jgi:cytoskeletal protein CcmA (bactofilin family)
MFEKNKGNKSAGTPSRDANTTPSTPPAPQGQPTRAPAVIGQSITIRGDVSGDENLVIEGKVEGEIRIPTHEVVVGTSGQVSANIQAKVVRIEGHVQGDIAGGEKVIIVKEGNVRGNIVAPRVTLEDGAVFKGSIDMNPGEASSPQLSLSGTEAAPARKTQGEDPSLALKSG